MASDTLTDALAHLIFPLAIWSIRHLRIFGLLEDQLSRPDFLTLLALLGCGYMVLTSSMDLRTLRRLARVDGLCGLSDPLGSPGS